MANKNSPYFEDFVTMVRYSCQAAEYLQDSLRHFDPATLPERRKAMHDIENAEDMVKHDIMKRLVKEFIPPIDREDIIQLASELDDITDKIEDILIRIYMYNIREILPEALDFAGVIVKCCNTLMAAMEEFHNFHKSTTLKQAIIDVNTMEEEGDAIYIRAVHTLYQKGGDPIHITAWSELFDRLEDCCDACEHVADAMEIVVLKNS